MVIGTPVVLNLIPGGVTKVVHVNQVNDNIEIQFQIMNGSQPYNVTEGVSCTIRGTKGDSYGYTAEAATTVGSNVVTVTLTEQLTAVAGGCNVFELVFVGAENSMKVSTENFILAVERAALGEDTVISDSDLAYAAQVLDQLQSVGAVNAQVQQNKANIAAEVTRATAAEQMLQQNINSEASARQSADNTLQSNINVEASARATQDNVLQAEIDQLVAPSGSAPSAAEVTNARIGADGTTYDTLGNAIRGQVTDVKSALLEENIIRAEYHPTSVIPNATIYSNGVIVGGITGENVYVFNISVGNTVLVTGGTVYGYYATEPEKNGIPSTDSTRHIATLNRTLITMPSGANYLAIKHTAEPTVLDGSKTTTDRVDDIESVIQNVPTVKSLTAQQFSQAPYYNTIGNLDRNSIINVGPSYNAVDYPYGESNYYTIITTGESSSYIQIAIRIDGRSFHRKRGSSGWYAWATEALESSNLQLSGSSPTYTDFDDFPVGSILSVNALSLTNSPEGYGNTGHNSMDSGVISAVVMTYATKHDDPTLKAQLCLYYRNVSQGAPRIAYRTALLYNGSYIWTNWSMYSEDSAIHATNKIVDINHLDYTFDDFDDAPINTIYQVDLNVANAVAHNPAPGKSGSLMTYGFSNSSRHALTQIYIALDNGVPKMFFRYGVINSSTEYLWTSWYQVSATEVC